MPVATAEVLQLRADIERMLNEGKSNTEIDQITGAARDGLYDVIRLLLKTDRVSVSEFVSVEDSAAKCGSFNVTAWSEAGNPLVLGVFDQRGRAEELARGIRDTLATWPGWKRTD